MDISTPADVFRIVDAAVTEHFQSNPKEYTGEKLVVANNATDPLKFTLCVFWEYSHPGEEISPSLHVPRQPTTTESVTYFKKLLMLSLSAKIGLGSRAVGIHEQEAQA